MKNLQSMLKHVGKDILSTPYNSNGVNENPKEVQLYKFEIKKPEYNPPLIRVLKYEKGIETIVEEYSDGYDLPEEYDKLVNDAVFAIPGKAIVTIKYLLNQAESYSDMPMFKGYDTNMREQLLGIRNEFIHNAIKLICDYHYDPETKYYAKTPKYLPKYILAGLMIFKFWSGRTGRGLQLSLSSLKKPIIDKDSLNKDHCYHYITMEIQNQSRLDEKRWNKLDNNKHDNNKYGVPFGSRIYPLPKDKRIEDLKIGFHPYEDEKEIAEVEAIYKNKESVTEAEVFGTDPISCNLYEISCSFSEYDENGGNIGVTDYNVLACTESRALHIAKNKFYYNHIGKHHPMDFTPLTHVAFTVKEKSLPKCIEVKDEGILE